MSLASTFIAVTSSSSPSYSSSFLTKLRSAPSLRLSFAVSPLCSRRGKHMAHTIARATLGLTQISPAFEAPKVYLFKIPVKSFGVYMCYEHEDLLF